MRIEVKAKLILTVPEPKKQDTIPNIVLAAEHLINNIQGFNTDKIHTAVGIRIHVGDYQEVPQ